MYTYRAFGVIIGTEEKIPHLMTCQEEGADVIITKCSHPFPIIKKQSDLPLKTIPQGWIRSDFFRLDIEGVATYEVTEGNCIRFYPEKEAPPETVNLYLLGSCMGALLFQRHRLPMHGSLVLWEGNRKGYMGQEGILLTGVSGAGKSTIAAGLCRRGGRILTDDVAALDCGEDALRVFPSYPSCKLWEDAIERLDPMEKGKKRALHRIASGIKKYEVDNHNYFYSYPVNLTTVIELVPREGGKVQITPIHGGDKFALIAANIYRRHFAEAMDLSPWLFSQTISLAQKVRMFRLERPLEKGSEENVIDLVLKTLERSTDECSNPDKRLGERIR